MDGTSGEFTCGLYRSASGTVRAIILKRELIGGFSGYGEVIENPQIEALLIELAEKLELRGSINVQLRISNGKPVVFEINPRFSSTVLFRHMLGFQDLVWAVEERLGLSLSPYQGVQSGCKFYKGFQEYISKP